MTCTNAPVLLHMDVCCYEWTLTSWYRAFMRNFLMWIISSFCHSWKCLLRNAVRSTSFMCIAEVFRTACSILGFFLCDFKKKTKITYYKTEIMYMYSACGWILHFYIYFGIFDWWFHLNWCKIETGATGSLVKSSHPLFIKHMYSKTTEVDQKCFTNQSNK